MKKKFLLALVILPLSICKIVLAACPSGQTVDQATGHCIKIQSSCSGKCTYYYDTTTHDVRFEKNANVPDGAEVVIPGGTYSSVTGWGNTQEDRTIRNVTIGEGITGMGANLWAIGSYGGYIWGTSDSTLKLPSTYKYRATNAGNDVELWNVGFGTIDASAVKNTTIYIPINHNQNIVLDPNSGVKIDYHSSYSSAGAINIICKGEKAKCQNMVTMDIGSSREWKKNHSGEEQVTTSYYEGDDGNGNWEVWSDEGKAVYADSSMQKLLSKYDFDGNQTGFYEYDRGGNLVKAIENGVEIYRRRIYTVAEATAAVNGDKNTFKLMYR